MLSFYDGSLQCAKFRLLAKNDLHVEMFFCIGVSIQLRPLDYIGRILFNHYKLLHEQHYAHAFSPEGVFTEEKSQNSFCGAYNIF